MNTLCATTYAAINSLHTALRQLDPPAARRGERRAELVRRLCRAAQSDRVGAELAAVAALVSEIGLLVTRAGGIDEAGLAERSASLLEANPATAALAPAVRHQHERWDGAGGPAALAGSQIPQAARLIAVANVVIAYGGPLDEARVERARAQQSKSLDPDLVALLTMATVEGLDDEAPATAPGELAGLRVIGDVLEASHDLPTLLGLLLDELRVANAAADAGIARLGEGQLEWVVASGRRFKPGDRTPFESIPNVSGLHRARTHAIGVGDGADAARYLRSMQAASMRVQPIENDGVTWGNLIAVWDVSAPPRAAAVMAQAARQASVAINYAERLARLERWALRDAMTGLGNRRLLEDRLSAIFHRPPLERRDCALLMIDVDGLKVVNDTLGHSAGDRLLVAVADALVEAVADRPRATVCRIGGDEFCIILDGGGMLYGEAVAERVARLVTERDPTYSVSIGLAHISADVKNMSMLLRAADLAQYEQKRLRKGFSEPVTGGGPGRRARRDG